MTFIELSAKLAKMSINNPSKIPGENTASSAMGYESSLVIAIFIFYSYSFFSIDSTKEVNSGHWLGRLVSHGKKKDQNCKMKCIETKASQKPHLCLFAIKDIPAGHELLYDYGISDLPWEVSL